MKCPWCNAWTIVLETRQGSKRRRECGNGHRYRTVEITDAHYELVMLERRLRTARAVLRLKGYLR